MIINGTALFPNPPIVGMLSEKQREHGVSHGLSEAGYDIRIKQDIWFNPAKFWCGRLQDGPSHQIDDNPPEVGVFALASAIEEFDMPYNLVGIVHDKSTWARQGLSVFNTVIEPGWKGFLTLELVYHGSKPLHIPAGAGIAQVVFHQLIEQARYGGKYQNQADEPVGSVFKDD